MKQLQYIYRGLIREEPVVPGPRHRRRASDRRLEQALIQLGTNLIAVDPIEASLTAGTRDRPSPEG